MDILFVCGLYFLLYSQRKCIHLFLSYVGILSVCYVDQNIRNVYNKLSKVSNFMLNVYSKCQKIKIFFCQRSIKKSLEHLEGKYTYHNRQVLVNQKMHQISSLLSHSLFFWNRVGYWGYWWFNICLYLLFVCLSDGPVSSPFKMVYKGYLSSKVSNWFYDFAWMFGLVCYCGWKLPAKLSLFVWDVRRQIFFAFKYFFKYSFPEIFCI